MAVNISGTVLASLFYDQSSSKGDQVGFLVGDLIQHVTDTISDSQINNVAVETKIFVYDCLPCPHDQRFYNSRGDILQDKITNVLKLSPKNIIGWYSFRRNTSLRPSFRERMLQQNLSAMFSKDPRQFLLMLCTSKPSTNRSTHTFDHCFLQLHDTIFQRVLMSVVNLGETTHTDYKHLPSHTVSSSCGLYNNTVNHQQGLFLNTSGQMEIQNIRSLNGALSSKLQDLSGAVIDSEHAVSQLEAEVEQLRVRAQRKKLEKQQREQRHRLATSQPPMPSDTIMSQPAAKQPSVDDLLSMDCTGTGINDLVVGQGHSGVKGQTSHSEGTNEQVPDPHKDTVQAKTSDRGGNCDTTVIKHSTRLTAPVALHSRSSSTPVEQMDLKPTAVHKRSRSGDANSKGGTSSGKGPTKVASEIDPFSFVSSMIKGTNKDETVSKVATKAKSSKHNTTDQCRSGQGQSKATLTRKNSNRGSDAVIAAARNLSKASTASVNRVLRGRNSSSESSADRGAGRSVAAGDSSECALFVDVDAPRRQQQQKQQQQSSAAGATAKPCSQEVSLGRGSTDSPQSEAASSQDTYEMDISSSPVY